MQSESVLTSDFIFMEQPQPQDFDNYFPFACKILEIPGIITICRQVQAEYVSPTKERKKSKNKSKFQVENSSRQDKDQDKDSDSDPMVIFSEDSEDKINIIPYYDVDENLIQLRITKNEQIPCTIFKVLAMIIQFYESFNTIHIDRGLNSHSLKELNNFLLLSNVTDICLDDTRIMDGEYHILLENKKLRQLSLSRCMINDIQIEKIASYLHYPEKCSETLSLLNLAANKITDTGAKYLAAALRSNRYLSYLNLGENMITDAGGISILDSLTEFILTADEIKSLKIKYIMHLKRRASLIAKFLEEIKTPNVGPKHKVVKKNSAQFKSSVDNMLKLTSGIKEGDYTEKTKKYDLAAAKADRELGEFNNPFSNKNTVVKNEFLHCKGNTKLCYLNLAYNNLTLVFVNKLIKVLKHQKSIDKKYTGLLRVIVEGNQLPSIENCEELQCASNLLESNVANCYKRKRSLKSRCHIEIFE